MNYMRSFEGFWLQRFRVFHGAGGGFSGVISKVGEPKHLTN